MDENKIDIRFVSIWGPMDPTATFWIITISEWIITSFNFCIIVLESQFKRFMYTFDDNYIIYMYSVGKNKWDKINELTNVLCFHYRYTTKMISDRTQIYSGDWQPSYIITHGTKIGEKFFRPLEGRIHVYPQDRKHVIFGPP